LEYSSGELAQFLLDQWQQLIGRLAEDNPASVADVIQMWMNQDKKNG
jgi:flagellar biosynthesis/type III secretory pathway M-ring protein FliF/YscJ